MLIYNRVIHFFKFKELLIINNMSFYTIIEFFTYFFLFAIGDFTIYFSTNKIYDILFRKPKKVSKFKLMYFPEFVLGNTVSYILIYLIYTQKIGFLYFDITQYNIIYTFISPFIYLFLQDFIFYILHRIVHIPFLYNNIHYLHHLNRYPSSWAVRVSHYIDSNIENIAFTAPALLFPIHSYLWKASLIFSSLWGNFLHDSTNKKNIKYMNDNHDHCLHHYYGLMNYNFSYYFNHWDIFFGTYKKRKPNLEIIIEP